MTGNGATVVEVDSIGVAFGRTTVLTSASLVARGGEITALLGRNGCGKTTMFRAIAGRVRTRHGRVRWLGQEVNRPSLARLSQEGLMYSAQDSSLSHLFDVEAHVDAFVRRWGGRERVDEVFARMELDDFRHATVASLSGGERQRASIALALLRRPRCLLADEPFSGVAPKHRPLITGALRTLTEEGCAVLLSGHDVREILEAADRIWWMTSGTTHRLGSPEEAVEHFQFRKEYLGPGFEL